MFQDEATTSDFKENLLWGYQIFVGESPNYQYNAECEGSPYITDGDTVGDSDKGKEIWCNRAGEYVSLVRDFADFPDMQSISICDLPIFGDPIAAVPV